MRPGPQGLSAPGLGTLHCPCCHPHVQVPNPLPGAFPLGRGTDDGAKLEKWNRLSWAGTLLLLLGQSDPTATALTGVQALWGRPPAPHQAGSHILATLARGDGAGGEHGLRRPSRHLGPASEEAEKVVFLLQLVSINRGQPCLRRITTRTTTAVPIVWGGKLEANPKKLSLCTGAVPAGAPWSCTPGSWSLLRHGPFLLSPFSLVGMSPRG